MDRTISQTVSVPPGWNRVACALWETGQHAQAIQQTIQCINSTSAKDPLLALQLGYYLYLLNDFHSAATVLERQLLDTPGHIDVTMNLAVLYSRVGRHNEAVDCANAVIRAQPSNTVAFDVLCKCLHQLGRDSEAREAGSRALELKDLGCETIDPEWLLPSDNPRHYARRNGKRDTISFSLWGSNPRYLRGLLRNLLLAPDIYPGWVCRCYLDDSVPEEFIELIDRLGGQIIMQPGGQTLRQKLCRRFGVADDPCVGHFIVRDADSVIGVREMLAVQAWLASDAWFHCMRDWWTHTDLVLAGMWGGVAGVLPPLQTMLSAYRPSSVETPNIDQLFLREQMWAHIRRSCLTHDRYFISAGALPFPGSAPAGDYHVGQNEYAARPEAQERLLRPWIEQYRCLRQASA